MSQVFFLIGSHTISFVLGMILTYGLIVWSYLRG